MYDTAREMEQPLTGAGFKGRGPFRVDGTCEWMVDFYSPGPPPFVVEYLSRSKRDYYEKLVKLLDVKAKLDARAIMVVPRRSLDLRKVQLAGSFGVYVVVEGDTDALRRAVQGEDVTALNELACAPLLRVKNRVSARRCRELIVGLLEEGWLTAGELEERLGWGYDAKTVRSQLRTLQLGGLVEVVARARSGEGLYGLPGAPCRLRGDLSRRSRGECLRKMIAGALSAAGRPLTSAEIATSLGVPRGIATSTLRELCRAGAARMVDGGWTAGVSARSD